MVEERREVDQLPPDALAIPSQEPLWAQIFSGSRVVVPEVVHDDFIRPPTSFPHVLGGTPSGHPWKTVEGDMGIAAAGVVENASASVSTSILSIGPQGTAKISAFIRLPGTPDAGIYGRWLNGDNHILLRALDSSLSSSGNDALRLDRVVGGSATSIEVDLGTIFTATPPYLLTLELNGPIILGTIYHRDSGEVKSLTNEDPQFNTEPHRSTPFVGLHIGANTTDEISLFTAEVR